MKSWHRLISLVVVCLSLASCGDVRRGPDAPVDNPMDQPLPEGALVLEGAAENTLNPAETVFTYVLSSATFDVAASDVKVVVNGVELASSNIAVSSAQISASTRLQEGRNEIRFKAYDSVGRPVFLNKTIWAGSNTLTVNVVDSDGAPIAGDVALKLSLSDDPAIGLSANGTGGSASFANVPSRTVIVEARTADNRTGVVGGIGSDGLMTIRVLKFNEVDPTDNNDFSQGLAGYQIGNSPVEIVAHEEDVGPTAGSPAKPTMSGAVRADRSRPSGPLMSGDVIPHAVAGNADARLRTSGEGPQSMSRTFVVKPGTSSVSVRYRFVTEEVPGGYFGSEYNDYFSLTIRSKSGQSVTESNTMNGLGLAAFDAVGSTAWKTLKLKVDKADESIQVDFTVANVADGYLDSVLMIDGIEENVDQVTPALAWDPVAGGLKVTYKVGAKALENPVDIDVHWASGPTHGDRIGARIKTIVVPAGTAAGATGGENILGPELQADPAETTHLLAIANEMNVAAISDVRIAYDANADASAVSAGMSDVIKDSLRIAGVFRARISRTAVSPADQARAMFQNLVRAPGPLSANIAEQLSIYAGPGDAVIRVFESMTAGMTIAQAIADSAAIRAAMLAEIMAQGPSSVSKHCADPATISVVDVPVSSFTATNGARFSSAAGARARLLQENGVYHLELANSP